MNNFPRCQIIRLGGSSSWVVFIRGDSGVPVDQQTFREFTVDILCLSTGKPGGTRTPITGVGDQGSTN